MHTSVRVGLLPMGVTLVAMTAVAEFKPCDRPFIWMNKQEIEGARRRMEEPWAERGIRDSRILGHQGEKPQLEDGGWYSPFRILVLGDEERAKREKAQLLSFIGGDVKKSKPRSNRVHDAIRYDMLYDRLTADERKGVEDTFRKWIHYHLHDYWRGRETFLRDDGEEWDSRYTRVNWLPNMLHTRGLGIFMMALALQDEALIKECFETPVGGFKWWMDHYVADRHFYMEEFNKQYSTFGELLLWCRGCKRLGMDEMGFGYVGQGDGPGHSAGATMKRYVQGWIKLGFPAVPVAGGMPALPNVHMGDVGPCQMVPGYPAGATQMHKRWGTAHMNGPAPRMLGPFWFELAHAQWPDAGFDWVLAQMRLPADEKYYPSLFFNLDPVDPSEVKPFPVASYVAPERGFGMLRMEESPEYWSSPRPAAALQFALQYVHYVHDCFTLLHYVANRHPVYGRVRFGPHQGYAGGHPWQDSVRGHNGIVVDSMQIQPVDTGEHGSEHTQVRHHFAEHVKFLAIHAEPKDVMVRAGQYSKVRKKVRKALYPDTAVERVLCLTDEYMLDIIRCASDRERVYHWNHNPHGKPQYEDSKRWEPSDDLNGGKLWENMGGIQKKHGKSLKAGKFDLTDVRKCDMKSEPWRLRLSRGEKQPGVVIRMLGGQPTTVYCGVPLAGEKGEASGMTTTIAERKADKTAFVVLHEPCLGDARRIVAFERIHQNDSGVAVRIRGSETPAVNDRVLIAYAKGAKTPLTLGDKGELFTFQGYAHVRLTGKRVLVSGDLRKMRLTGTPSGAELIINGKPVAATVSGGVLLYEVPE